jgi:hypothetical protein
MADGAIMLIKMPPLLEIALRRGLLLVGFIGRGAVGGESHPDNRINAKKKNEPDSLFVEQSLIPTHKKLHNTSSSKWRSRSIPERTGNRHNGFGCGKRSN